MFSAFKAGSDGDCDVRITAFAGAMSNLADRRLVLPLIGIASCLSAAAVSLDGTSIAGGALSLVLGFLGLCILMAAAALAPIRAMCLWGLIYVPLSGLWLAPALDPGLEVAFGFFLLSVTGLAFYGGVSGAAQVAWRVICGRLRLAPKMAAAGEIISMAVAIALAEATAAAAGFVLAPIGLMAVYGGPAWSVAAFGIFVTSGCLVALAALTVISFGRFPALSGGLFALTILSTFLPAPSRPAPAGITMAVIAHNPDPEWKWTPDGSVVIYDALVEASFGIDADLIIWPENAVTATFDLDVIAADPPLGDQAHLFGMTRFVAPTGPLLVNSAVLLQDGRMQASDKRHLAPLIERSIPMLSKTDLIPGTRRTLSLAEGTAILPLLCYEVAFPLTAQYLSQRPDIIIVLAAETGFWQHMTTEQAERHARARELETGIRVLRVSDRKG